MSREVVTSRWWTSKPEGLWLKARGWRVVSETASGVSIPSTAACQASTKRIIFADSAFRDSSVRHREYVMLHEIAHAIHFEVLRYISAPLVQGRGLDYDDAKECVADAYCYRRNFSPTMKGWVQASVRYHKLNTSAQYTMADVASSEARSIVDALKAAVL